MSINIFFKADGVNAVKLDISDEWISKKLNRFINLFVKNYDEETFQKIRLIQSLYSDTYYISKDSLRKEYQKFLEDTINIVMKKSESFENWQNDMKELRNLIINFINSKNQDYKYDMNIDLYSFKESQKSSMKDELISSRVYTVPYSESLALEYLSYMTALSNSLTSVYCSANRHKEIFKLIKTEEDFLSLDNIDLSLCNYLDYHSPFLFYYKNNEQFLKIDDIDNMSIDILKKAENDLAKKDRIKEFKKFVSINGKTSEQMYYKEDKINDFKSIYSYANEFLREQILVKSLKYQNNNKNIKNKI